ncbi:arsenic resistance N-acetyltransferase ArsN2 [Desulfocicer niacini]
MEITKIEDRSEAADLLNRSLLPTSDLGNNDTIQLFGIYQNKKLIACIGVEIYGESALLRSLAVDANSQKNGKGKQLLGYLESFCIKNGVQKMFLLTETAVKYFEKFGYNIHERQNAPISIKGTAQFSSLCPTSSAFMLKILNG